MVQSKSSPIVGYPNNEQNTFSKLVLYVNNQIVYEWYLKLAELSVIQTTEINPSAYNYFDRISFYKRFHAGLKPSNNEQNEWLLCCESDLTENELNTDEMKKKPFMVGTGVYINQPMIQIYNKYRKNVVFKLKSHKDCIHAMRRKNMKLEIVESKKGEINRAISFDYIHSDNSNNNQNDLHLNIVRDYYENKTEFSNNFNNIFSNNSFGPLHAIIE